MSFLPGWFDLRILYALLLLDAVTTALCVKRGWGSEANPLLAWAMGKAGFWPALLGSHLALAAFYWLCAARIGITGLWCIAAFWCVIVGNNLRVVVKAAK